MPDYTEFSIMGIIYEHHVDTLGNFMNEKKVFLIRHAESMSNAGFRTLNPMNNPLSTNGKLQAIELAKKINLIPELIVWSTFIRTKETAQPLVKRYPQVSCEEWSDIYEFTYLNSIKCVNTTQLERKIFVDEYWNRMDPNYCDGGNAESFSFMLLRVKRFINKIQNRPEKLIYIFTHGQFIEATKIICEFPNANNNTIMQIFNQHQRGKTVKNCEIIRII